ncbi:MAG: hypothetical protein U5K54_00265 [Cytophagales bacterium]|nr:hypothetical protein [Cytophagales bacterium]
MPIKLIDNNQDRKYSQQHGTDVSYSEIDVFLKKGVTVAFISEIQFFAHLVSAPACNYKDCHEATTQW